MILTALKRFCRAADLQASPPAGAEHRPRHCHPWPDPRSASAGLIRLSITALPAGGIALQPTQGLVHMHRVPMLAMTKEASHPSIAQSRHHQRHRLDRIAGGTAARKGRLRHGGPCFHILSKLFRPALGKGYVASPCAGAFRQDQQPTGQAQSWPQVPRGAWRGKMPRRASRHATGLEAADVFR